MGEVLAPLLGLVGAAVVAALVVRVLSVWCWSEGPTPESHGPRPTHRPIERLADRLRVLGAAHHFPAEGTPRARREGTRRAYEDCLAEACDVLEVPHLLDVLPPGPARDAERTRVEFALTRAGLDLGLPST